VSGVLAFDVGKSGCRVARFLDGARVGEAGRPAPGGLAGPGGPAAVVAAMVDAVGHLEHLGAEGHPPVEAVTAGIAGFAQAPQARDELTHRLARTYGVDTVVLASDMTTSHLGALRGGPGVVVAAGTGAVALAVSGSGGSARVDGWGYLLGDSGSGYDIARRGLHAALRAHDGRRGSSILRDLAARRFGDLSQLPRTLHAEDNPARMVAGFAYDVLDAAQQGDEWSRSLWHQAGVELARSAAAAAVRVDMAESVVSTTGGLFGAGPLLTEPFVEELARRLPAGRWQPPDGDALDGGHLMATETGLPHEHLLARLPANPPSTADRQESRDDRRQW